MENTEMQIEFILLWVDGNDSEWQIDRRKDQDSNEDKKDSHADSRFRDMKTLKYALRTIEYDIDSGSQSKPYRNFLTKMKYRTTLLRKNDILFNSSEYFAAKMISALKPEKIYNLGSPRLDILKYDKEKILEHLEKYQSNETITFIKKLGSVHMDSLSSSQIYNQLKYKSYV